MNTVLYIYSMADGIFSHELSGAIDSVIASIPATKDFTLTPPPDYEHIWRWTENKWTTDDTAN